MIPPLSTRRLQTAIEAQRRTDADLRWRQSFRPAEHAFAARRDIPAPLPARR